MTFVQLVEYTTTRPDEMDRLMEQWMAASNGKRTISRVQTCTDRDRPNTYVEICEFPSYEVAMQNSNLPETTHFAEQLTKLCDDGPTFRNLDVVRDERF